MIEVNLTKEQIQAILVFMTRTQLNGSEVGPFNEVAKILREALQSEEPKKKNG